MTRQLTRRLEVLLDYTRLIVARVRTATMRPIAPTYGLQQLTDPSCKTHLAPEIPVRLWNTLVPHE